MSFPIIWSAVLLLVIDTQLIKLREKENIMKYLVPQVVIIIFLIAMAFVFDRI